jgi:hypothetical protein
MTVMTAEYIWIDGSEPVPELRSKARVLPFKEALFLYSKPSGLKGF